MKYGKLNFIFRLLFGRKVLSNHTQKSYYSFKIRHEYAIKWCKRDEGSEQKIHSQLPTYFRRRHHLSLLPIIIIIFFSSLRWLNAVSFFFFRYLVCERWNWFRRGKKHLHRHNLPFTFFRFHWLEQQQQRGKNVVVFMIIFDKKGDMHIAVIVKKATTAHRTA